MFDLEENSKISICESINSGGANNAHWQQLGQTGHEIHWTVLNFPLLKYLKLKDL